tara:strand:- start:163 stop:612 length:450 start_codon:yes stop_codon:yes gene_type:complete
VVNPQNGSELLSVSQLAEYLGMAERTIFLWVQQNKLPAFKLGTTWRFRKSEIDGWIESNRTGPNPSTFSVTEVEPLSNNLMNEKMEIEKFKTEVQTKMELNKGSGKVSFDQFTKEFSKEVIKKGLKELEKLDLVLEETGNSKTKYIIRR